MPPFEPSDKAKKAKAKAMKKKKPAACKHQNLVPLELHFAKVKYTSYSDPPIYDYAASIINSNIARVKTYYCPACHAEIPAPQREVNVKPNL